MTNDGANVASENSMFETPAQVRKVDAAELAASMRQCADAAFFISSPMMVSTTLSDEYIRTILQAVLQASPNALSANPGNISATLNQYYYLNFLMCDLIDAGRFISSQSLASGESGAPFPKDLESYLKIRLGTLLFN